MMEQVPFQLATLYTGQKLPSLCIVEPKFDGIRLLVIVRTTEIEVLSRRGKRVPHIEDLLAQRCRMPVNIVLDTELFVSDWNLSMSIFQKKELAPKSILWVFDGFTISEMMSRKTPILIERKKRLDKWLQAVYCPHIKRVDYQLVGSEKVFDLYRASLKSGFEGIIVKDPYSTYQFGQRTTHWLKIKPKDYETLLCIGVEPGTGKNKNRLGALILKRPDGSTLKVGSGFTDKEREILWRNPPIGKYVEIELTVSKQKKSKAIFPVFVRVREDL